ncbi:MAG: arginine--tRNA ligase, partial [Pseudomonadota bacterium]
MNLYRKIKNNIIGILQILKSEGVIAEDANLEAIDVSPPREASHGDMATNAAMVLANKSTKKPRELAEIIASHLKNIENIASVQIAGPGFINITFEPKFWQEIIKIIIFEGNSFGNSDIGKNQNINIEYVSANPTGPIHVGHARGAVYGDALAMLLLKTGFNVTKEYYINDAGAQVDKLARAVAYRYLEALGEKIDEEIFAGLYPGDYLIPVGEAFKRNCGEKFVNRVNDKYQLDADEERWLPTIREFAIESMIALIKDDLACLGIQHDVFTSERELTNKGAIEKTLSLLDKKGLIYKGVLEAPKGKAPDDWEPREQTLFKSTSFGDDTDRAIKKSDGSWTYFAPDIAYH